MHTEPGTTIRRARLADVTVWVETLIEATIATYDFGPEFASLRRSETAEQLAEAAAALADPRYALWLAEDAEGPLGVAETGPGPQGWEIELGFPAPRVEHQLIKLYLLPRAQGRGLGQAMLQRALGTDRAYLWVFASNRRAVDFYQRHGFVDEGIDADSGPTWANMAMRRLVRTG
ncbi:GNAT family N-acetyltransferase [Naumannella halotolerans]|uniref:GNAT family N-acetyltransferase n=1 Tax=Naumannella halotolerans TaxID=993414 RepID=UPI00370D4517